MRFQDRASFTEKDVEDALARNEPEELLHVPIAVSLSDPDLDAAQALCLRLAVHPHPTVRGNAILGFGHLARRFGKLDEQRVKSLIENGLKDPDDYVRGQADAAADDVRHFLKWKIKRL